MSALAEALATQGTRIRRDRLQAELRLLQHRMALLWRGRHAGGTLCPAVLCQLDRARTLRRLLREVAA